MTEPTACCRPGGKCCDRCELLVGLDGLGVIGRATTWCQTCSAFRHRGEIATLDPFRGYKNAIDDQLEDARAVLDAFHIVKLGTKVVDDVRRRVEQQIHGHRGRKGDPLYGVRNLVRAGEEHLTDRQRTRLERAWAADERHVAVEVAWH